MTLWITKSGKFFTREKSEIPFRRCQKRQFGCEVKYYNILFSHLGGKELAGKRENFVGQKYVIVSYVFFI